MSSDYDYIRDHALRNVWCTPNQDTQCIIEPAHITPKQGSIRSFKLINVTYSLPDETSRWHVYQIGGIHPIIFNLFTRCSHWTSISEACNTKLIFADIYAASGIQLPRCDSYYHYGDDGNMLVAVKSNKRIAIDLTNESIYLRFYSNAFYSSPRSNTTIPTIHTEGKFIENASEINQILTQYNIYAAESGHTYLYINGVKYLQWPSEITIKVGDVVEFIYDGSVKKIHRWYVKDLPDFESILDNMRKYILHYNDDDPETIDYQDDIDVYVYRVDSGITTHGVYYHKNLVSAMRMLTHRDYSISTTHVKRYTETISSLDTLILDPLEMYVEIYIRHSGWRRDLVFENSRIHELYKLEDDDLLRAMAGFDATVDVWRAENLEKAAYPEVMRSDCSEITATMVESAYGYNAISKILADTPTKVAPGETTIPVPYKLQFGCTGYEYDENGLLIGYKQHVVGSLYQVHYPNTAYVELIAGLGSAVLDEHYGVTSMTWNKSKTYRVYKCMSVGGVLSNSFVDVTEDYTQYSVDDSGTFTWISSDPTAYPMVRSDGRFLARDFEIDASSSQFTVPLASIVNINGTMGDKVMTVPMGQIDVFLNGRSLIRGLEYFVDFPVVHIVNAHYLFNPLTEKQHVHVRFCGFCYPNGTIVEEGDLGFVEHGLLSSNSKYDLRDDKVLRIVVGGGLKDRSDLEFSEDTSGVSIINVLNGAPYMVKDILVPIRTNGLYPTYELRDKSKVIDKAVSNYLTLMIPEPQRGAPSAIVEKHRLFSPFICTLLFDIKAGRLTPPIQTAAYSKQQVIDMCMSYEYILNNDPVKSPHCQDMRYVVIMPHHHHRAIDIKAHQYQFLQRAVEIYTNGLVSLSPSVTISG